MKKSISATRKLLFLVPLLALLFTVFSSTASAHNVSGVGPRPVIHNSSALQSSPPCYETSCFNQDPYVYPYTLCSRDYGTPASINSDSGSLGTMWNVYSSSCHANWVEGQLNSTALNERLMLSLDIKDIPSNLNQHPPQEELCLPDKPNACPPESDGYQGPYVAWSNMIDGQPLTIALGQVWGYDTGGISLGHNFIQR